MTHTGRSREAAAANGKSRHANPGFATKRWRIADNDRGNMSAAEYTHVVHGFAL